MMFYNANSKLLFSSISRMMLVTCTLLLLACSKDCVHAFSDDGTNGTVSNLLASSLSIGSDAITTTATAGALQWSYATGGSVSISTFIYTSTILPD